MGSDLFLTLDVQGRSIKARTRPDAQMARGDVVQIHFDPKKVHLFDGDTGQTLLEGLRDAETAPHASYLVRSTLFKRPMRQSKHIAQNTLM